MIDIIDDNDETDDPEFFLDDQELDSAAPIVEREEKTLARDESGHQRYSKSDESTKGTC